MTISKPRQRLVVAERISLWALTIGSALLAVGIAVFTVILIVSALGSDPGPVRVAVNGPVGADSFPNALVPQHGQFVMAELESAGLPPEVGVLLTLSALVSALTYLTVAASTAVLGWRLLRNDPFRASVVRSILASSVALILGSAVAALLGAIGGFLAQQSLVGDDFMLGVPFNLEVDAAPILIGVALGLVAGAFELGVRMRADTEGLV